MKALIAVSIALIAVPLFASAGDEQAKKKTSEKTTTTSTSGLTQTTLSDAGPAPGTDSPLVRAAKATGRLGKKPTNLITNETLAKNGGHVTTTKVMNPLPPVAPPSKASAAQNAKSETVDKAKKAEEEKRTRAAKNAAADIYGESIEERVDDPSLQEHVLQQSTSTQAPQTVKTDTQKPPQN